MFIHINLTGNLGATEALALLKTAEDKVAYLIQTIAIHLHKASKEIDSTVGLVEPTYPCTLTNPG